MREIGSGGAVIGCRPNSLPGKFALAFCDGSMGEDRTVVGAGVGMAVGAADVADAGVSPNTAPAGRLPEGGGTGANKLFHDLELVDAAVIVGAGGVVEGMVIAAAGGLVGSGTVAPEGVTTTGGGWVCCAFNSFIFCINAA